MRPEVLVLDDEKGSRTAMALWLEIEGFQVQQAASMAEVDAMSDRTFQAVVYDLTLPDGDAYDLPTRVRADLYIAVSGHAREEVWALCRENGAHDFFQKPVDPAAISARLKETPPA